MHSYLGYLFGLIACNFLQQWHPPGGIFPTIEMRSRGELRNLWIGSLIALPSGAAVALSILSGAQCSLIGVAISASLLPPCVNAGLLWAHATIQFIRSTSEMAIQTNITGIRTTFLLKPSRVPGPNYDAVYFPLDISSECIVLGIVSIFLTVINVIFMFFSGLLFLKASIMLLPLPLFYVMYGQCLTIFIYPLTTCVFNINLI